jgi:hypothetical protein
MSGFSWALNTSHLSRRRPIKYFIRTTFFVLVPSAFIGRRSKHRGA